MILRYNSVKNGFGFPNIEEYDDEDRFEMDSSRGSGIAGGRIFDVGNGEFAGPSNLQYNPSPTLSPYLYLFNNGNNGFGALNNYNAYVRPAEIQNQLNSQQNQSNYQQSSQINQLQQQLNQVRESTGLGTTGFSGHIRPTGQAATYLSYSHYYTGSLRR